MLLRELELKIWGNRRYHIYRDYKHFEELVYIEGSSNQLYYLEVDRLINDNARVISLRVSKNGFIDVYIIDVNKEV